MIGNPTEHARVLAVLSSIFGDTACEDAGSGEVWEYMGTHDGSHQFRHRQCPAAALERAGAGRYTGPQRTYLDVPETGSHATLRMFVQHGRTL